jgi:hypothetical protein
MDLQVGNREKMGGLIILCLVAIGTVHWFVFMSRARDYREAYDSYQDQRGRWSTMVSTSQEPQIRKFIKDTQSAEDFVDSLARDLNLQWEPYFFDFSKAGIKKRQDRLLELINQVCDLRKTHPKLRLTFLDWHQNQPDNPGWDIPSQLPTGIPLWDLVDKLRNNALTLRVLSNPLERQRARLEYNGYLRVLGINPDVLDPFSQFSLAFRYGDLVPLIKRIAHARLIWDQKLKDEKGGGTRVPIATMDDLYSLLEVKVPEDPELLFNAIKQLQNLLKLIKMAEEQQIEEINNVVLLPLRKVDMAGDENNKPALMPEQHFDHFFNPALGAPGTVLPNWPGAAMRPNWPGAAPQPAPGMMEEVGVGGTNWQAPGAAGRPAPAAAMAQTPGEPQAPAIPEPIPLQGGMWIGNIMPIRFGFIASWETSLNFVYVISHNRNPFEVDSWDLKASMGGKIQTDVTLAPMARVQTVEALYAPETTTAPAVAAVRALAPAAPMPAPGPAPTPASAPAPPSRLGFRRPTPTPVVEMP